MGVGVIFISGGARTYCLMRVLNKCSGVTPRKFFTAVAGSNYWDGRVIPAWLAEYSRPK